MKSFALVLFLLACVSLQTVSQTTPAPHHKTSKARSTPTPTPAASPSPTPDVTAETIGSLAVFVLVAAVGFVLYFLPTMVAIGRRHRNRNAILVTNIFLGWTFVGWVAALIWASTADVEPKAQAAAGPR